MTWMIMRSSSGGLREAPAGQGPCPAPGPSTTIYYFHYLLLLSLLMEIYHVYVLTNTKMNPAFYFLWKVFILDPTSSTAVHCTIWATFSVGPTIWEPCTCWTDFKGISMPSSLGDHHPSSAEKEMSPRISLCYKCGGCLMKLKQN